MKSINKTILTLLTGLLLINIACLKEDDVMIDIPSLDGNIMAPNLGGSNQANQVWIDLSTQETQSNLRSDWDLGFYAGEEFRVILNYSSIMVAVQMPSSDINDLDQNDFQPIINQISQSAPLPPSYIDNIYGDYFNDGTAIDEISSIDEENKVYLLKLGYEPFYGSVAPYTTNPTGNFRGYRKVRILRNDDSSYKVQFANLNDSEYQEVIIEKDPNYHFTFFSFKDLSTPIIQPPKNDWDLCFTVFNNVIPELGTYIFSDFVLNNSLSNVISYEVIGDPLTLENQYNNFEASDVNHSLFIENDQTAIGSKWRETVSGTVSTPKILGDRFYVIKDAEERLFKLRFISMLNENNERGYPVFIYKEL